MRVVFVERDSAPERLVCEAEVVFEGEAGPLAGMKLVGFSLWRSPEGEVYVTFPSRAFGAGNERRFFDFLRSVEGTSADSKRVKAWILEQYRSSSERRPTHPRTLRSRQRPRIANDLGERSSPGTKPPVTPTASPSFPCSRGGFAPPRPPVPAVRQDSVF